MVQLIEKYPGTQRKVRGIFQFYYGSINSDYHRHVRTAESNFNSTMVQLIVIEPVKIDRKETNFNSTMVQLIEFCSS